MHVQICSGNIRAEGSAFIHLLSLYERALRTSSDRNLCLAATRSEWELGCYTLPPPFFPPLEIAGKTRTISRVISPLQTDTNRYIRHPLSNVRDT